MDQMSWLVNEIKEKGPKTPQTIIFCCSLKDIATIVNWFLMMLDNKAFYQTTSTNRKDCLIGIYHSLTHKSDKDKIAKDLKEGGITRIVLATTALSMGVNSKYQKSNNVWPTQNNSGFSSRSRTSR